MRKKKARALAEAEAEAARQAAAAAAPARRTVAAPVAGQSPAPQSPAPQSPAPQSPAAPLASAGGESVAPAASMPDRVDALTEAIGGELGRLRGEIRGRDADLVQALQQVAASYDRVAARLDDERRVQELLAEALIRIDRRLAAIEGTNRPARDELPRSPRVIGGSIAPRQDIPRIDR